LSNEFCAAFYIDEIELRVKDADTRQVHLFRISANFELVRWIMEFCNPSKK